MRLSVFLLCIYLFTSVPSLAAELIQLNEQNFDKLCPHGKESDAIYGDWILRNEHIVAVIAQPVATRNANMGVRNVGGMVIDLTLRSVNSDQLGCFYPAGGRYNFHDAQKASVLVDGQPVALTSATRFEGRSLSVRFEGIPTKGTASTAKVTYQLGDADEALAYQVELTNTTGGQLEIATLDTLRCDGPGFKFETDDSLRVFWAADAYFGQAYGILPDSGAIAQGTEGRVVLLTHKDINKIVESNQSTGWSGKIVCSQAAPGVRSVANALRNHRPIQLYQLELNAPDGDVTGAPVEFKRDGKSLGIANSDGQGWVRMRLEQGDYEVIIRPYARSLREHKITLGVNALAQSLTLEPASRLKANVVDQSGKAIPAKLQINGLEHDGKFTESPNYGPDSADFGVRNVLYTANGQVSQPLAPGKYSVLVSHGPEYDAITKELEVKPGLAAALSIELVRSVDTTGWVSGEFHSHSTPSGDNTSSQLGRVLNLLAEHLEFAPCTEHNRIDTYEDELALLRASSLIATCTGMELTGSPLPVNHQNAFPLRRAPRTQDGGAPVTDVDPVVQIKRLAMWDDNSDKVVQMNHPHLPQILGDRDLDGTADDGFREMFSVMDVVEIHPLETIFSAPAVDLAPRDRGNNRTFAWMQLINLGYRVVGVVNTDAHYNWHGSGWLRNYIASSSDVPSEISLEEMLKNIQAGHMTMTTAPFLQAELRSQRDNAVVRTLPGASLDLTQATGQQAKLWIRVQCANWYDINRVQVFANGRPLPEMNFTRGTHPGLFRPGSVRFEHEIALPELKADTHFVVATIGEGLKLGEVFGEEFGKMPPVAVANPIYVDIDGGTFKFNGDNLGVPFMLPEGASTPGTAKSP